MRRQSDGRTRAGIVAFLVLAGGVLSAESSRAGNDVIFVPISWCAHQGSNADTGATPIPQPYPNTPPDTATDAILWRRHERVTDAIYMPQGAKITFRSAITNPFDPNRPIKFPKIPDNTSGPGTAQTGDVVGDFSTQIFTGAVTEARRVWDQCRTAWSTQYSRSDGIHAVNINRFVDTSGNRNFLGGLMGSFDPKGDPIYAGGGLIVDNTTGFFTFNNTAIPSFHTDPADQLLGHELGHALGLDHRSGDTALMRDMGHSVSLPSFPHFRVDNLGLNSTEIATLRATALTVSGHEKDPPNVFIPGDYVGALALDETEEHDIESHLDLAALHAALHQEDDRAAFGAELFAPLPGDATPSFWFLVDADGDSETGAGPSHLASVMGPPTAFAGAEIVIQASIDSDGEGLVVGGAVWRFGCPEGMTCDAPSLQAVSLDDFAFRLQRMRWFADPGPGCETCSSVVGTAFHNVAVSIRNDLVGLRLGSPFFVQVLAVDGVDVADTLDETPEERGQAVMLSLPDFAHCFPQSDGIVGRTVPVLLEGLLASAPIHGLLGPRAVFTGSTDATGGGTIDLPIPADTLPGDHLVTVGVDDSAFTADCTVNVVPNTRPTVMCPAPATIECTSASGTPGTGAADVADADGDALTVTLNVDGTDVSTAQVPAGGPPTSASVPLTPSLGLGQHSVRVTVSDGISEAVSCTTTLTVTDTTAPVVSCAVGSQLAAGKSQPSHELRNVGFMASAEDACDGSLGPELSVFGDEDDEEPTGDGTFSPDAMWGAAPGTLRLRSERKGDADGRVYLIVPTATDTAGNAAFACCTDVVPSSTSARAASEVASQAQLAAGHCASQGGAAPAGYFSVGDGAVIGPKQ